ncbi:hypothetical protein B834_1242 [Enterococcus mundtii 1A]|uniref:hypothetical protein n=1 Tax=Enterococcus TaxID=1350 RepID=UPI0004526480|nr:MULTISPECIES: hypothetical protein [Enterococcus]EYT96090.1 hypothetical protein AK89_05400 [Enterococcus mundtii CRL35]MDA9428761.1 hypothetical protein [Enterococcus mundtii 1A]MEC3941657.1 hypothetical protein [Enterococcus mundtii]
MKNHYRQNAGITLTDEEAYTKLGTTLSIGFENEKHHTSRQKCSIKLSNMQENVKLEWFLIGR